VPEGDFSESPVPHERQQKFIAALPADFLERTFPLLRDFPDPGGTRPQFHAEPLAQFLDKMLVFTGFGPSQVVIEMGDQQLEIVTGRKVQKAVKQANRIGPPRNGHNYPVRGPQHGKPLNGFPDLF